MARVNCLDPIVDRITSLPAGEIFVISDFSDLADDAAIRKVLSRLEGDGKIRRIMRGIYERPIYNDFLGEYVEPHPDRIARAIARNYGWTIVPCGDTALNMLGLSTQVPVVWLYVSDGNYREYRCGNITIQFKHTANREISNISSKTALIIQAIKALGKDKITDDMINKIKTVTSADERELMFIETKYATSWIYEIIKDICGGAK